MRLRKGNLVEILRRENEPDGGSWFPGQVISVRETHFLVRYESLVDDDDGEPLTEKVGKNEVRPRPPPRKAAGKWAVGDVAEVFDGQCWRVGRIVKAVKNDNFVVKLSGFIQLKQFHESNLRVQLVWHKNKWFLISKQDAQNRSTVASRPTLQPIGRLTDACSSEKEKDKFLLQTEASTSYEQCSVASCSSNDFLSHYSRGHYDFGQASNVISENSDAESSFFPSLSAKKVKQQNHLSSSSPTCVQKLEAEDIHALEFHAYRSTVNALYASGPLSWEQELLLTNLRQSLHISDEEHLFQLRHLLSTQVL